MSQNLPLPISFAVVPTEELKLVYDDNTNSSITIDSSGNLNLSAQSDIIYNQGSLKSNGWIRGTEILSTASTMSTTLDTTFNSVNSSFTATLGIPTDNQTKNVQLFGKYCNPVNVDCNNSGGGTFTLNSYDSFKTLKYYNNCWNILPLSPSSPDSFYPTTQVATLSGTGITGTPGDYILEGSALAISKDGNTLAVGALNDNNSIGALFIFVKVNGSWVQQGPKLVGTGNTGISKQGSGVAISSDGNTVACGGNYDNNRVGAVWVFNRTGSTWVQQGSKLVATGYTTSQPYLGYVVAISGDGNTLAMGSGADNGGAGAVWIFTRTNNVWTQQGSKLVGTGATSGAYQGGDSIALSSDGNTLVVGGSADNLYVGATWVFTRSGTTWSQYGSKLVSTAFISDPRQGVAVAIGGSTIAVGGSYDNTYIGGASIFILNNGSWVQQGGLLLGTGATSGYASQGSFVALSSDGNTLASSGITDTENIGATWIFTRTGSTWAQKINKLVGTGIDQTIAPLRQGTVSISGNGNTLAVGCNDGYGGVFIFS